MATGNNVFTELATNTCQRNGPIVFGAMLVSLLKYRPNIGVSASAWILCRASQRNAKGESLVALAKEGFKAFYCLCMHGRCL